MRDRRSLSLSLVVALLATAALAACGGGGAESSSATCREGEIRFGVEPFEDPAKLTPAVTVLGEALEKSLDCPVKIQVTQDYSAEVLAMQNGKLDVGMFGPLGYVFAYKRAGAEAVASFADANGTLSTYTAGIWVPKDSDITSVEQLRGRSLALSSVGSTSGDALPRKALNDAGVEQRSVKITYAGGHPQALLALANGKVDAAEINSQQLASATASGTFDRAKFRQVWTSAPIPNDPITVRGDMDPAFKNALKEALLKLDPAAVGQIGALLDVTPPGPLVAVDQSTYQPLFDLATALGLTEKDV
ncbi:phosphate/phosphite/phosphonate ABC transporter substrate-binding protein [Micromonospora yasonensis]|uniref:phosphate/phosphite/phosphonate ABC transporter substrate-binding protein n=1 Tax=Micromonospora yasonensis TaxID=1128667 RepID=UPI00222E53D6|nr:phosphate/phosphite/phosphonate ABC transporter substrate-binding protein [Micromonospora yasonensis]MCW3844850.1 phosphate/phosphite/phosphonate ABC transporter substrate-binding protein [Micromonospora yasonensis]